MGKLLGKVAIVTGAASGIGRGIAREFAFQGARVLIVDRDTVAGNEAAREIAAGGGAAENAIFHEADLLSPAACTGAVASAVAHFGHLDILVNNAGDFTRGNIETTSTELWDRHMALNVRAPFLLLQACLPHFQKNGGGAVINIGSVNAYGGGANLLSYSVSKGALMTFTRNAANALSAHRIRVNLLNAGWTLTEGEDRIRREESGDAGWLQAAVATRPFGRLLSPHDVASAALYFASDESALISGAVLDMEQSPVS
jgi:NAD(P)-dependent dehydrogenase (short-subunit alcohol dehydrogenase family)